MDPRTPESDGPKANNVSPIDEILAMPGISVKLKMYTFCKQAKVILLKSVRQIDAFLGSHSEKDKLFDKVHEQFIANLPVTKLLHHARPSVKTLWDKFRAMLTACRTTNRNNATVSGIAEAVIEETQLLYDFLHELEDAKLNQKPEKDELNENEKRLLAAGEKIQRMVLERSGNRPSWSPPSRKK